MTIVTVVAAVDVSRILARRGHAIMADPASAQNLRVIDGECGVPDIRCVAVLADVAGLNMGERFTGRFNTVVATDTISRDVYVIEIRGQPGHRRMAIVAGVVAIDVGGMLACCSKAVMARTAGSQNLSMVDSINRCPDIAVMAVFTDIGRLYVAQVLAGRVNAIVTTRAVSGDVHVIKIRRPPGNS